MQRFWLVGACKPEKSKRTSSNPLSLEQFLSAFLLLIAGIVISIIVLGAEHLYDRYMRQKLNNDKCKCCPLVSKVSHSLLHSRTKNRSDEGRLVFISLQPFVGILINGFINIMKIVNAGGLPKNPFPIS